MKSREPSASNRLWPPALSLIQIFRSHARANAHAREASVGRETASYGVSAKGRS